jgi:hypothetical protein
MNDGGIKSELKGKFENFEFLRVHSQFQCLLENISTRQSLHFSENVF